MKLYTEKPQEVTRLTITRKGEKTKTIALVDTDCHHSIEFVKALLSPITVNILNNSEKLQITARGYKDTKAFASKTISCRGISIDEVEQLILNNIK